MSIFSNFPLLQPLALLIIFSNVEFSAVAQLTGFGDTGTTQQPVPDPQIVTDNSRFVATMTLRLVADLVGGGEEDQQQNNNRNPETPPSIPTDFLLDIFRAQPESFNVAQETSAASTRILDWIMKTTIDRDPRLVYDGFGKSGTNSTDPFDQGLPFVSTAPSQCFRNGISGVDTSTLGFVTPPSIRYNYIQRITPAMITGRVPGQRFPYQFDSLQSPVVASRELRRQLAASLAADIAAVITTNITNEIIRAQQQEFEGVAGGIQVEGSGSGNSGTSVQNQAEAALEALLYLQNRVTNFDTSVQLDLTSINKYAIYKRQSEATPEPDSAGRGGGGRRQGFTADAGNFSGYTADYSQYSNTVDFTLTIELDKTGDQANPQNTILAKKYLRDILYYSGGNNRNNGQGGIPMPSVSRWLAAMATLQGSGPESFWKFRTASDGTSTLVFAGSTDSGSSTERRYQVTGGISFSALEESASITNNDNLPVDTSVVVYRTSLLLDAMDGAGLPWGPSQISRPLVLKAIAEDIAIYLNDKIQGQLLTIVEGSNTSFEIPKPEPIPTPTPQPTSGGVGEPPSPTGSDGGCQGEKKYFVFNVETSWSQSLAACGVTRWDGNQIVIAGEINDTDPARGRLASVQTDEEQANLVETLKNSNINSGLGQRWWLSASDQTQQGLWIWGNGLPLSVRAWAETQPDNEGGNEYCMSADDEGNWYDDSCFRLNRYVCEYCVITETVEPSTEEPSDDSDAARNANDDSWADSSTPNTTTTRRQIETVTAATTTTRRQAGVDRPAQTVTKKILVSARNDIGISFASANDVSQNAVLGYVSNAARTSVLLTLRAPNEALLKQRLKYLVGKRISLPHTSAALRREMQTEFTTPIDFWVMPSKSEVSESIIAGDLSDSSSLGGFQYYNQNNADVRKFLLAQRRCQNPGCLVPLLMWLTILALFLTMTYCSFCGPKQTPANWYWRRKIGELHGEHPNNTPPTSPGSQKAGRSTSYSRSRSGLRKQLDYYNENSNNANGSDTDYSPAFGRDVSPSRGRGGREGGWRGESPRSRGGARKGMTDPFDSGNPIHINSRTASPFADFSNNPLHQVDGGQSSTNSPSQAGAKKKSKAKANKEANMFLPPKKKMKDLDRRLSHLAPHDQAKTLMLLKRKEDKGKMRGNYDRKNGLLHHFHSTHESPVRTALTSPLATVLERPSLENGGRGGSSSRAGRRSFSAGRTGSGGAGGGSRRVSSAPPSKRDSTSTIHNLASFSESIPSASVGSHFGAHGGGGDSRRDSLHSTAGPQAHHPQHHPKSRPKISVAGGGGAGRSGSNSRPPMTPVGSVGGSGVGGSSGGLPPTSGGGLDDPFHLGVAGSGSGGVEVGSGQFGSLNSHTMPTNIMNSGGAGRGRISSSHLSSHVNTTDTVIWDVDQQPPRPPVLNQQQNNNNQQQSKNGSPVNSRRMPIKRKDKLLQQQQLQQQQQQFTSGWGNGGFVSGQ